MPDDKGDEEAEVLTAGGDGEGVPMVVYATFSNEAEAIAVAEALVGAGLVACANIVPGITSVFIWEGRLEREREVAMIMKTRLALADEVIAAIKARHSYDNPAITAWPIARGSASYLDWIAAQTAQPGPVEGVQRRSKE